MLHITDEHYTDDHNDSREWSPDIAAFRNQLYSVHIIHNQLRAS